MIGDQLHLDEKFINLAVEWNGLVLQYANKIFRLDKKVCLKAVS